MNHSVKNISLLLLLTILSSARLLAQVKGPIMAKTAPNVKTSNAQLSCTGIYTLDDSTFGPVMKDWVPVHFDDHTGDTMMNSILENNKAQYIRNYQPSDPVYKTQISPPVISKQFLAQPASPQYTPNDNSLAISKTGYMISCINSSFYIYDTNGINLKKGSFNTLVNTALPAGGFFYDPRVYYDPISDRFYMVVLYGQNPETSRLIFCCSSSNNPTGTWNTYVFNGGFGNNGVWVDYPQIGVSKNEIFITGNLFDSKDNFNDCIVLQIDKQNVITGQTIDYKLWSQISGKPFSLSPAVNAMEEQINDGMTFVTNDASGGNKIYIYKISGRKNNNPRLTHSEASVSRYSKPPDAIQKGNADKLDQGGCRIKNAYVKDGLIHTVFAKSTQQGFGGIVYMRLDIDNNIYELNELYEDGKEFAFPSVAPASNESNNRLSYIYFLVSGNELFPESRIVACDQKMEFTSTTLIKDGDSYVDILSGKERWGDYTTIVKTFDNSKIDLWTLGSFGTTTHRLGNVLTQFHLASDSSISSTTEQKISVYPNPASKIIHINYQFPISVDIRLDIISMEGILFKSVDVIKELRSYSQTRDYDVSLLPSGVYEFVFRNDSEVLDRKKIVIVPFE